MYNIITWHTPSNNGAFQKQTELGIFSDLLTVKPTFSFEFTSMEYIEQNGTFQIDGQPMTNDQKDECFNYINTVVVPLAWYKQVKQGQLAGTYQQAIQVITGIVDPAEMVSWYKQENEARTYLADSAAVTPILSVLVISRNQGETVQELAEKIVSKAERYDLEYASILGIYKDKQKQLEMANSIEEILAIS